LERLPHDLRWRAPRTAPEVPHEPQERTWKAVTDQCLNARMPGYTGFVPSANAEHIYGCTKASVGHTAVLTQQTRHGQSMPSLEATVERDTAESSRPHHAESSGGSKPASQSLRANAMPSEHPLGMSRAAMMHNHWVPTIPGYGGHIPGKHAENICGGGIIHTCKMAGRAIAERNPLPPPKRPVGMQENLPHDRLVDCHHARNSAQTADFRDDRAKLAAGIREHCSRQIPGYTGHIPRVNSESIYGATARSANLIAADHCDDRIFHPEEHARRFCEPQGPGPRQLRL